MDIFRDCRREALVASRNSVSAASLWAEELCIIVHQVRSAQIRFFKVGSFHNRWLHLNPLELFVRVTTLAISHLVGKIVQTGTHGTKKFGEITLVHTFTTAWIW